MRVIWGTSIICVQSMCQTRGVRGHAPPRNFDFGPFIRHNLVESGTVFAQSFIIVEFIVYPGGGGANPKPRRAKKP